MKGDLPLVLTSFGATVATFEARVFLAYICPYASKDARRLRDR